MRLKSSFSSAEEDSGDLRLPDDLQSDEELQSQARFWAAIDGHFN